MAISYWMKIIISLVLIIILTTGGCTSLDSNETKNVRILCAGDDVSCNRFKEIIPLYEDDNDISITLTHRSEEKMQSVINMTDDEINSYDLIIMNHKDMASLAENNQIEVLDNFMDVSSNLNHSLFEWPPLMQYGEYPIGSGVIYALPFDPDALGIVYRSDLFTDHKEQADFLDRFGYELEKPFTYQNLLDEVSFFTRPSEGLFGIGLPGSKEGMQGLADSILLTYGGSFYDPLSSKAEGTLDSVKNCESLALLVDLYSYAPPSSSSWTDDALISSLIGGEIAMAIIPFSSFEQLVYIDTNNPAADYRFASLPGQDANGSFRRIGAIMGESIGIVSNSDKKEIAWDILQWFYNSDIQLAWSLAGGQPARESVQDMSAYFLTKPYNFCFPTSLRISLDPWRFSDAQMVTDIYRSYLNRAIHNEIIPDVALQQAAKEIDANRIQK